MVAEKPGATSSLIATRVSIETALDWGEDLAGTRERSQQEQDDSVILQRYLTMLFASIIQFMNCQPDSTLNWRTRPTIVLLLFVSYRIKEEN